MNRIIVFILFLSFNANVNAINTPILNSPANAATFSKFDNFLYANAVTGAKGYQFQIDTFKLFKPMVEIRYQFFQLHVYTRIANR
jgi:hypothetical protein